MAKGLSRMKGNLPVRFLGGWGVVTSPGYPVVVAGAPAPALGTSAWQPGRGGVAVWRRRRTSRHTATQPIAALTGLPWWV